METLTLERPALKEVKKNNKVRELIKQLPILSECKCAESLSARFAELYDFEYKGNTAFDCTYEDLDNPGTRLAMINPCNYNPKKIDVAKIGFARLVMIEARGYQLKGLLTDEQLHKFVTEYGTDAQRYCPEIDDIITFDKAMHSWWWQ